ncbi:DUF4188 domain-containing protein [Prauserella rugosa]|uniref:Uncharacterized protein DUF4188 n=1 Tax=Prauserella rugosa TaxID=43354 RepID=A0A660CIH5_9PSEU|nr:DUF4188 domain-containing protein [Prauserella rugosa]KMS65938.1 hypothetical protein ACZ91_69980 [Streptomyces regensis]TWH20871.1 uncharacterized protein DUF4188 [Prauserella rugosa]
MGKVAKGKISPGRVTHAYSEELVVFHIGMTLNRWWRPDVWMPVFRAFRPMLQELSADADSGLLSYELLVGRRGPYAVQYWSSIDKLYDYASATDMRHRPAWSRFNAMARKVPGAVGIWHETFLVERAESMYVDTPVFGLPGATEVVPVQTRHRRARTRLDDGATGVKDG